MNTCAWHGMSGDSVTQWNPAGVLGHVDPWASFSGELLRSASLNMWAEGLMRMIWEWGTGEILFSSSAGYIRSPVGARKGRITAGRCSGQEGSSFCCPFLHCAVGKCDSLSPYRHPQVPWKSFKY